MQATLDICRMLMQEIRIDMNEPHVRTGNVLRSAFDISENSKNPEKTMEFINLLNTDKYLRNLVSFGIYAVVVRWSN